jgi:ribosome maturation factor RimP
MVLHRHAEDKRWSRREEPPRAPRLDLEALVRPTLESMGYGLVRVILSGREHPTLQIMAERQDGKPMGLEDCETISRTLSAKLDVEDPITRSYTLEVSSPGIDRPLTRPEDYRRFVGESVRLETREARAGRRRFTGRIAGAGDASVSLACEDGAFDIAFTDIARARLVAPSPPPRDKKPG